MPQILETPLPDDFYKEEGWVKSLVNFYGEKNKKLPVSALQKPMEILARAIYNVSFIYGNFPDVVYDALGQAIDPLFAPKEYHDKIYAELKQAAEDENRPLLADYAEALYTIRRMYGRDKEFYEDNFSKQMSMIAAAGLISQQERFGSVIQEITKVHVNQVRKMVADRK